MPSTPTNMQCIEDNHAKNIHQIYVAAHNPDEHCVWIRNEPSPLVFFLYAFIVPVLSCFGFCANFINLIVFMRPKMTPSAFTYLAALSCLDCLSCLLITLTAFSRSIFYSNTVWLTYDFQCQTPLFGITTGAANLVLACVSFDRFLYLRKGMSLQGKPRFCTRKVARLMVALVVLISVIANFPYFFVFVVNKDGTFRTTDFYYSHYYKIHNWFSFLLLTVLPAIFMLVGNIAIIIAFNRWAKQSKKLQQNCSGNAKTTQKRYQHQMKLTITILIVITLYMIGELPAHLTSRKSALNLLFGGDITKVNFDLMERMEIICIILNSLQLSMNLLVYAIINPSFMPEFFSCLRGASDTCFTYCGCTAIGRSCHSCCSHKKGDNTTEVCVTQQPTNACPGDSFSSWNMQCGAAAGANLEQSQSEVNDSGVCEDVIADIEMQQCGDSVILHQIDDNNICVTLQTELCGGRRSSNTNGIQVAYDNPALEEDVAADVVICRSVTVEINRTNDED